jgi:hypothetical protein
LSQSNTCAASGAGELVGSVERQAVASPAITSTVSATFEMRPRDGGEEVIGPEYPTRSESAIVDPPSPAR